jgi:hypothetical protein
MIVKQQKISWTNALAPGANYTKYTALAMHADRATCQKHEDMGFHQGWGAALDQLVAHMKCHAVT